MRRVLSLILALLMVLTIQTPVAFSANIENVKTVKDGALTSGMTASYWSASTENGFKGKDSDDKVLKLTTTIGQSDPFITGGGAMATTDNKTFKKYFVTRFNFYPVQENKLYLRSANNNQVINKITSSSYNLNEWNSVVIYLDFTKINPDFDYDPITQPTEALKSIPEEYRSEICPAGFAYVNGVKVDSDYYASRLQDRFGMINTYYHPTNVNKYLAGEIDSISKTGPEPNKQWRLGFNPTDKTKEEVGYIDDLYTYYTDELPDISMPEIKSSESITVTEDKTLIIYNENMTVAELPVAEDEFIVAYSDADFTTALSPTSVLKDGNVIIVKDDFDQMTKYTVSVEQRNVASVTSTQTEITARANLHDATLILAGYDDKGNLKEVKCSSDDGFNSLSVSGLCYSAKAFVLDSFKTLKPLEKSTDFEQQISVACWGDSITRGQGSTGDDNTYPGVLSKLTGYNVINMGIGGETATSVAARQGGIEIRLDKDITIPESGAVDVEFSGYFKDGTYAGVVTPRTTVGGWNPCYINGIEGTLSIEVDETKTPRVLKWAKFTRKESGEAIDVPKGSVMTVEANKTKTHINVFMLNANGGWSSANSSGPKNNEIDDHIKLFDSMIANTPDNEKFIVLGLAYNHGNWETSHDALEKKYGDHFINIKKYLATEQALIDAGITPTEEDYAQIAQGNIPKSFYIWADGNSDGVHLNDAGYERIAYKVYERMQELGYSEKSMVKCWPEYKRKALTIGFDDCVKTDDMVIEMLNDAGVPGTFNIVASYLNSVDDEILERYEGHEIANHSQTHLKNSSIDAFEDVKGDVVTGQNTLENRFPNHDIFGMAIPSLYYSPEFLEWLRSEDSGIKYVRTDPGAATSVSLNYELPEDWYLWTPTHTLRGIGLYRGVDYIDDFFNVLKVKETDTLKVMFTWGHPIYFVYPDWASDKTEGPVSLENFERILAEYKEHSDEVWAATHGQVYEYANALDGLVIDRLANTIYNPSDVDIYLIIGGENTLLKAGETINY